MTTFDTLLGKKKAFGNTVGKGENAGNQHFLLFPQCCLPYVRQSSCSDGHSICLGLDKTEIQSSSLGLILYRIIPTFNESEKGCFTKHFGNGENAGNQHFFLFPKCFLPIPKRIYVFKLHLFCHL